MDNSLPFTPPPHYVSSSNLPRRTPSRAATSQTSGESSIARRATTSRSTSGRVQKTKSKKRRPGLSINTNVTRPRARPEEIPAAQLPAVQVPAQSPGWQNPVQNSPTRFPATYLDVTRRNTVRKSITPENLMYFAPPPGSSVYSSRPSSRGELSPKNPFKRRSKARESVASDISFGNGFRGRTPSNASHLRVEDSLAPDSANTMTSHRSRGWWNVITTPFENATMSREWSAQPGARDAPAVPAIPAQYASSTLIPSRQNTQMSRQSNASSTLSPNDREVPILFAGSPIPSNPASMNGVVQEEIAEIVPPQQRNVMPSLPFQPTGRTPPSGRDDFSPTGIVTGQGTVAAAPTIVNVVIHQGQSAQAQDSFVSREQPTQHRALPNITIVTEQQRNQLPTVTLSESSPTRNSVRRSVHNQFAKTVRFLTPRSSRAVEPGISSPPSERSSTSDVYFNSPPKNSASSSFASSKSRKSSLFSLFRKKSARSDEEDIEMPYYVYYANEKEVSAGTGAKLGKKNKKLQSKKDKKKSKRRTCCMFCCIFLLVCLALLGLIVGLAVGLTRHHGSSVTWVNITNYPGIPTGELTIVRPNIVSVQSGCVSPATMWSCDVPPEQQSALRPNDPDQPNFNLQIIYSTQGQPAPTSSPTPPNDEDEQFLGNTTDGNSAPFQGESTPFYISFLPANSTGQSAKKVKRQGIGAVNNIATSKTAAATSVIPATSVIATPTATTPFPNLQTAIPRPSLNPDGTPEPANLLPFPAAQPLRLFNRGQANEHYGFYTYFDRNIFLRSDNPDPKASPVPADATGGSSQSGANFVCTWAQTRYLVQIWTKLNSTSLLSSEAGGRPGKFPYPVTITLDRHGGDDRVKTLVCWALQVNGQLNMTARQFQLENRAVNGTIINPSTGPFSGTGPPVTFADGGPGGVDGGTGGCHCKWQNFQL
jgi:hypothetical protein